MKERIGERVIAVGHMHQQHDIGEATADRDKTHAALAPLWVGLPHKVRPLVALQLPRDWFPKLPFPCVLLISLTPPHRSIAAMKPNQRYADDHLIFTNMPRCMTRTGSRAPK